MSVDWARLYARREDGEDATLRMLGDLLLHHERPGIWESCTFAEFARMWEQAEAMDCVLAGHCDVWVEVQATRHGVDLHEEMPPEYGCMYCGGFMAAGDLLAHDECAEIERLDQEKAAAITAAAELEEKP